MRRHDVQCTSSPAILLVGFLGTTLDNTGKGLDSFSETVSSQKQTRVKHTYSPHVVSQYPSSLLASLALALAHPVSPNDLMR